MSYPRRYYIIAPDCESGPLIAALIEQNKAAFAARWAFAERFGAEAFLASNTHISDLAFSDKAAVPENWIITNKPASGFVTAKPNGRGKAGKALLKEMEIELPSNLALSRSFQAGPWHYDRHLHYLSCETIGDKWILGVPALEIAENWSPPGGCQIQTWEYEKMKFEAAEPRTQNPEP